MKCYKCKNDAEFTCECIYEPMCSNHCELHNRSTGYHLNEPLSIQISNNPNLKTEVYKRIEVIRDSKKSILSMGKNIENQLKKSLKSAINELEKYNRLYLAILNFDQHSNSLHIEANNILATSLVINVSSDNQSKFDESFIKVSVSFVPKNQELEICNEELRDEDKKSISENKEIVNKNQEIRKIESKNNIEKEIVNKLEIQENIECKPLKKNKKNTTRFFILSHLVMLLFSFMLFQCFCINKDYNIIKCQEILIENLFTIVEPLKINSHQESLILERNELENIKTQGEYKELNTIINEINEDVNITGIENNMDLNTSTDEIFEVVNITVNQKKLFVTENEELDDLHHKELAKKLEIIDSLEIKDFENFFGIGKILKRDDINEIKFSNDNKLAFICKDYTGIFK